jgi:subtilisin family serine protease
MPTKYLVLRTNAPVGESFAFSSPSSWDVSRGGPTDLAIQTFDGHETDVGDLRADRRNVAVMDAEVTLALIEPRPQAPANIAPLKQVGAVKMPDGLMAVGAHTTPFTGQGVTVAILDTGIDEKHPAFQGKTIAKRDFTGEGVNDQDVRDDVGHGTHCAATICAAPVGDTRVGVAFGVVKLCVGKVLGDKALGNRGGTLEMLLKGLFWAVLDQRASVVSMSLSYDLAGNTKRMIAKGVDPALAASVAMRQQSDIIKGIGTLRAFLESQSPNVVFVAATGNESDRPQFVLDAGLPASELFSVGAVGPTGNKWDIAPVSNGRAQIVAPGVDVLSAASGGGWAVMSGTSMATPHVAGVAALWTEKLRDQGVLSVPESVRSALKSSAVRQPLLTNDINAIGVGLVQAPQV